MEKVVRIGVLGCGNVGAPFVQLVESQAAVIKARTGVDLQVVKVAVRNISKDRDVRLPEGVLVRDAHAVVQDPGVDLVVELIGGIEPARELISTALRNGKPVVTGNKELLANVGPELWAQSDESGVDLLFEAAVAGGIPLIRALRESLRGEPISRVMGIVNGTTNFILTKMAEEGADYAVALTEAQRLGFAERQGDAVAVRVHPAMVPVSHPLASVRESYNAVFVEGDAVGSLMFYGRGAGGFPTASAVLGDVIDAAVNLRKGTHGTIGSFARANVVPIDETTSQYLLGLDVEDKPGVLHAITGVFATHGVSIRAAEQEGTDRDARLVFITHVAQESAVQACLREFRELDVVRRTSGLLRVIGA